MPRRNRSRYAHLPPTHVGATCPACGYGTISKRVGKYGDFLSCSEYPRCGFTQSAAKAGLPAPAPTPSEPATEPATATATATATAASTPDLAAVGSQIAAILATLQRTSAVDEKAVRAIVADMLATAGRSPVLYQVGEYKVAEAEPGSHAVVGDILKAIATGFRNIWLTGPSGCGKSHLLHDVARALSKAQGVDFATVDLPLSGGTTEADLFGRVVQNLSNGETVYRGTAFTDAYVRPSVILLDEADGADANVLLRANTALANGGTRLPDGRRIERHEWCVVIVAANTWGAGTDRQYVGRNQLDVTFMDRFKGAEFAVDYDRDLEARLCPAGPLAAIWRLRDMVRQHNIRQVVSTRAVVAAARLHAHGVKTDDILARLTVSWAAADRAACGVA